MRGLCGYGRYNDAPEHIGCPRAKSDMTPCVARDGAAATGNDALCVGCADHPADLLRELVEVASRTIGEFPAPAFTGENPE